MKFSILSHILCGILFDVKIACRLIVAFLILVSRILSLFDLGWIPMFGVAFVSCVVHLMAIGTLLSSIGISHSPFILAILLPS